MQAGEGDVRGVRGFVLLEVLIAMVIFATVVLAWSKTTDNALQAATSANQERTIRMLAARKLAEIRAKSAEMKEGGEGGFEEEGLMDVGNDPWGNEYQYEKTGARKFVIRCLGADNAMGGTGDDADIDSDHLTDDAGEAK